MSKSKRSHVDTDLAKLNIPAQIVVGITGHRKLDNRQQMDLAISSAISKIEGLLPPLSCTPVSLKALSLLSEGADRLITQQILETPLGLLEVVLPLEYDDYRKDFKTNESRLEFEGLFSQACRAIRLPSVNNRVEAYEQAGRHIVEQCDVLVALWDGNVANGKGGTAEVVAYARSIGCPLIWIHSQHLEKVSIELGHGIAPEPFCHLDQYNSECPRAETFNSEVERQRVFLADQARKAGLPFDLLRANWDYALQHGVKADLMAIHYQNRHKLAEAIVHVSATIAVGIVAIQIIVFPERVAFLYLEILLMLAALSIVTVSHRKGWNDKWIDYRFLAERFRSVPFIDLVSIDISTLRPPSHLSLSYSTHHWIVRAFSAFWDHRPKAQFSYTTSSMMPIRDFISRSWIKYQISYHELASKRCRRQHHLLEWTSYILFGLTICVAGLHIIGISPHWFEELLLILAITLPAGGAGVSAIRSHREYLKNSRRSAEMANHLKEIDDQMASIQDYEGLTRLIKDTADTMLHENEDWRVVIRFHPLEIPV